ncbi:MAG TPA: hypothetical protein VIO61_00815 [Anaerolineaceae bacterium]
MARPAEKASKAPEIKPQVPSRENAAGDLAALDCAPASQWLALQQGVGNQAVQRLARRNTDRRRAHPAAGLNLPIQLFRSGRVGQITYNEDPENEVAIEMPYASESLAVILAGINRVVQSAFGSRGRSYTEDAAFQDGVRAYLESIQHPSVHSGPPPRIHTTTLRFQVRLVREGERLSGLELLTRPQPPEPAPPEPAAPTAEQQPAAPPAETAPAAPTGEAPAPAREGEAAEGESGLAGRIASGLETAADIVSARWLWNPINEGMQSWERELDSIGDNLHREPASAAVLIIPISALYTILSAITGTLDLAARWLNPPNIALRWVATEIRVFTGEVSAGDLARMAYDIWSQVAEIFALGIPTAIGHLREAVREGNLFRWVQGITELALAALALLGMLRSVRARFGGAPAPAEAPVRTPAAGEGQAASVPSERVMAGEGAAPGPAEAVRPAEPTPARPSVPAAPAETGIGEARTIEQPAAPAEAGIGEARTIEQPTAPAEAGIGEARTIEQPAAPVEAGIGEARTIEQPAAPAEAGIGEARTIEQPAEPARPAEQAPAEQAPAAPRSLPALLEGWQTFEGPAWRGGARITQFTRDAAAARAVMDAIERGEYQGVQNSLSLSDQIMYSEWRRLGRTDPMPAGWIEVSPNGTMRARFSTPEIGTPEGYGGLTGPRWNRVRPPRRTIETPAEELPPEEPARPVSTSPIAQEVITDIEVARQRLAEFRAAGRMVRGRTGPALDGEWRRVQGTGGTPYAWVNENGVLVFDLDITVR